MSDTDTEQRTSALELGLAIIRLMLARGLERIALKLVLDTVFTVIELTPADRQFSVSRPKDRNYQSDIRNLGRNQDPKYIKHQPIDGLEALSYEHVRGGVFILDHAKLPPTDKTE